MVTMKVQFYEPSGATQGFFEDLVDEILMTMKLRNVVVEGVIVDLQGRRILPVPQEQFQELKED